MYLLDGNNIMGQRVGWHRDKAAARRRLVGELYQLAECLEDEIIVVFDAPAGGPAQRLGRLEVHYAREHETADDRIIDLAKQKRGDRAMIAVTSDRDLAHRLAALGVPVLRSGAFRHMLDSYQFPPL